MPGVAPAPEDRFAHDHEGSYFIEGIVHPVGLERGAMAGFMPAGIGAAGVEHAVDSERNDGPPAAPKRIGRVTGAEKEGEPEEVSRSAGPSRRCSNLRIVSRGTGGLIPIRFGQARSIARWNFRR